MTSRARHHPNPAEKHSQTSSRSSMLASQSSRIEPLGVPAFEILENRRVILASSSPRRQQILASAGLYPEVVASTFQEDLPKSEFRGSAAYEYPVETGAHKALEVFQRLMKESPENPPDLVIAADTVVVKDEEILEKPLDESDHARMIGDLNDGTCEVITGVTLVFPILRSPGYEVRSLSEITKVHFAESPPELLSAYVASGEGRDAAGGFAIQGRGALLIKGIEGDHHNVVGFPLFSFCAFLHELVETGQLSYDDL